MIALLWGIIIGTGLTIFALQNAAVMSVNFFAWQFSAPLAFTLIGVVGLSVLATLLAVLPTLFRYERQLKALRADRKVLADELAKYSVTISLTPPETAPSALPVWNAPREMAQVRR